MNMDKQYRQFARGLDPAKNTQLKILDVERIGEELKIVVGNSEPWRPRTCFHFRGVIDFDTFVFGGEEGHTLPQYFNSFVSSTQPHYEVMYEWKLLGDGTEWSFLAPYPEIILL
jgi:hypothetical protein